MSAQSTKAALMGLMTVLSNCANAETFPDRNVKMKNISNIKCKDNASKFCIRVSC